jgi:hypothetical protein
MSAQALLGLPYVAPADGVTCYALVEGKAARIEVPGERVRIGRARGYAETAAGLLTTLATDAYRARADAAGEDALDSEHLAELLEGGSTTIAGERRRAAAALWRLQGNRADLEAREELQEIALGWGDVSPAAGRRQAERKELIAALVAESGSRPAQVVPAAAAPSAAPVMPGGGAWLHRIVFRPEDAASRRAAAMRWLAVLLDGYLPEEASGLAGTTIDLRSVRRAVQHAAGGDDAALPRTLALAGSQALVSQVDALAAQVVGEDAARCRADARWRTIASKVGGACAMQVMIRAAYYPIAEQVWEEGVDAESAPALAKGVYREVLKSPTLAGAPVILNVGLGFNVVTEQLGPPSELSRDFAAATLLDKFGLALASWDDGRTKFETGVFVGGFLDALIRVAADEPDRRWLAGVTAGVPRMWGLDFGLEAHLALAVPFTWDRDPTWAAGAALVVPFEYALDRE